MSNAVENQMFEWLLTDEARTRNGVRRYAPLKRDYLRQNFGRRRADRLIEKMVDGGDIIRAEFRGKTIGYLPGERYLSDELVVFRPTDYRLIEDVLKMRERVKEHREREQADRERPADQFWRNWQYQLTVDDTQAKNLLGQLPSTSNPYGIQRVAIDQIKQRQARYLIDDFGRVHNSLAGLHSTLRPALRARGETLVALDISASQPSFLASLMKNPSPRHRGKRCDALRDARWERTGPLANTPTLGGSSLYERDVLSGQFYDVLMAETGLDVPRKRFKELVLRDVFGKRGWYRSQVEDAFARRYPDEFRFIKEFNANEPAALLRELQRVESDFVISEVGQRLAFKGGPFVSLHDGVFCRQRDEGHVLRAMDEAARAGDVGFTLKCCDCHKNELSCHRIGV